MEIDKIREIKKATEDSIACFVGDKISSFQATTGVDITGISFSFVDVSAFGETKKTILGNARLSLDLFT